MGKRNEIDGDLVIPGSLVVMGGFQNSSYSRTVTRLSGAEQKITTVATEVLDRPTYPEVEAVGIQTRYFRSATQPATPTGDDPAGWLFVFPSGTDPVWTSIANFGFDGHIIGAWSVPVRNTGVDGTNGADGSNGNLCYNAGFFKGFDGWHAENLGAGFLSGMDMEGWTLAGGHTAWMYRGDEVDTYCEIMSPRVHAVAGQTWEYYAHTGAHRCDVTVFIYWASGDGSIIGYAPLMHNNEESSGGAALSGYKLTGGFAVAPAGTYYAMLVVRKGRTRVGAGNSYAFVTNAFLGIRRAGQTAFSAWTPDTDPVPKYLGTTGTPTSTSSVIIIKGPSGAGTVEAIPGDYVLMTATTASGWNQGYIRRWNGSSWNELAPADYNEMYMSALDDVLALASETPALIASAGFFGTIFASRISALQIQFKEYVASISDDTPATGTRQVYMGKNPRYPNDATREYEFALQTFLGMNGSEEVWMKHFWTKMLASGVAALVLSGCVQANGGLFSNPGKIWASQNSPLGSAYIWSIAYGDGRWVAGGSAGAMATSVDGTSWALITSPFGASDVNGVAYGAGRWIAVGGSGKMATSTNGTSWALVTSPFGATDSVSAVDYGDGRWMAVGSASTPAGTIATSTNGTSWSFVTSPLTSTFLTSVAYGGGRWIAGSANGTITTSTNGTSWASVTSPFGTSNVAAIAYGNGRWAAGGGSGSLAASADGTTWALVTSPFGTSQVWSLAYSNGRWVAGGSEGKLSVSNDGVLWPTSLVIQPEGSLGGFFCAAADINGEFIIAGRNSTSGASIIYKSAYLEAGGGVVGKEYDAAGEAYKMFDGRYLRSYATLAESMAMNNKFSKTFPVGTPASTVYNTLLPFMGPIGCHTGAIGRVGDGAGNVNIVIRNTSGEITVYNHAGAGLRAYALGNNTGIDVALQIEFMKYSNT